MNSVRTQLRYLSHLFRRKNAKTTRIAIILLICICFIFIGVHKGSNIMPITIPYISGDPEGPLADEPIADPPAVDFAQGQEAEVASARIREALSLTMEQIRKLSPQEQYDRKNGEHCRIGDINIDDVKNFDKLTKSELMKCITLPETVESEMTRLHKSFIHSLDNMILPKFDADLYEGKGIVMVAGGKFTLIGMPAIKAIRANGDKNIPIEIMIPPDNNSESVFCEQILPELDPSGLTHCVYMEKLFDRKTFDSVKGYQLKSLALLASRFEQVLLLDADNYIVNSISNIFSAAPFTEHGLVLWPDYWRRLHHPSLYDIVGLKVELDKQVRYSFDSVSPPDIYKSLDENEAPFHDLEGSIPDSSTESGQLMIDKAKHLDTIILSLYYNFNGPTHYYPLLGQGYAGEGDKDTFALAAKVLHPSDLGGGYYQVKSPVSAMGHWTRKTDETLVYDSEGVSENEKEFRGVAMLQHNLEVDYNALQYAAKNLSTEYKKAFDKYREGKPHAGTLDERTTLYKNFWDLQREKGYDLSKFTSFFKDVPVTFVHSHLPKYNPWEFAASQDLTFDGRKVFNRHKDEPNFKPLHHGHYRMYNADFAKLSSYDLELANWSCFNDFICKKENGYQYFSYLKEQVNSKEDGEKIYTEMCSYISDRVEMLRGSTWTGSHY